jgi:hypothetical protein
MMKTRLVAIVIAIASVSSAASAEVVITCQVADGSSNIIKVARDHQLSDTHVYKLHYSGKTEYFFDDEDGSRGGPVKVICAAGKNERALVVYGEFAANYQQGFALIYNRLTAKIERLDFAEKGPPEWLYLGKNEAIVIAPTYGLGENGGKPYAAYRHIKGRDEDPDPEGVDVPTAPPGYDAIKLKQ